MYRNALDIHQKTGHLEGIAFDYVNLGLLLKERGQDSEARPILLKARDAFARLGAKQGVEELDELIHTLST
jgi:hypothetical protein